MIWSKYFPKYDLRWLKKDQCDTKWKVEELDLPEDPCNPDPGYSFYACVQKNTIKTVLEKNDFISLHFLPGWVLLDEGDTSGQCTCSRVEIVLLTRAPLRLCAFCLLGCKCRLGETVRFACRGDTPVDSGHPTDDEPDTFQKISTSHAKFWTGMTHPG